MTENEPQIAKPPQNSISPDLLPPQDVLPPDIIPVDILPLDALPQGVLPQDALPQDALPLDDLPQNALPQDSLPQDILPPVNQRKKEIKKTVNKLISGILLYELIMILVVIAEASVRSIFIIFSSGTADQKNALLDSLGDQMVTSGISYIISIFLGILLLFLYFKKFEFPKKLLTVRNEMSFRLFCMILCVFMSAQLIFSLLGMGMESLLNQFGYSILNEITAASSTSTTISMFLYASLLGPVAEEIVFRGFIMKGLEKYGRTFAIVVSAVVFGFYHGNLIQGIFAILTGLVLGYIAMEYSIKWSILFHITNNFIFGDLLAFIISPFNDSVQNIIGYAINISFFIAGIIILIFNRKQIIYYRNEFKTEKGQYRYTFTAIWMVVFLLLELLTGLDGIERI